MQARAEVAEKSGSVAALAALHELQQMSERAEVAEEAGEDPLAQTKQKNNILAWGVQYTFSLTRGESPVL